VRLWTLAASAALVVSAGACRDRDRDETASRVDSAATEVKQEVREAAAEAREDVRTGVRDLRSYTWAEREDFRSEVRQRLTDLDGQIDQLTNDSRSSGSALSDSVVTSIRASRKALDRRLAKLDDAAEDHWNELRDGLDKSLEGLRARVAELTRTGGPMGGRSPGQS
jgi:ABC-type transporter Mla subunit MlaD